MNRSLISLLKIGGVVLLAVVIVGYSLFRFHSLSEGVVITLENVKDGDVLGDQYLPLRGLAKNAVELAINGRSVAIDQEGRFDEPLLLPRGYAEVTIHAADRFGNAKTESYHFYVNKSPYALNQNAISAEEIIN